MKRLIITLLFGVLTLQTFAQTEAFNFKLDTKRHEQVLAFEGIDNSLNYVFINHNSLDINWLENGTRKNSIVEIDKIIRKSLTISGFADNKNMYIYFFHKKMKQLYLCKLEKSTHNAEFKKILDFKADDEVLKFVNDKNNLYVLSCKNLSNKLNISVLSQGEILSQKDLDIPFQGFYKALSYDINDINQDVYSQVGITQVSFDIANSLNTVSAFEKLYCLNGQLIFTFDESTLTHFLKINPLNGEIVYKKLNFKLEKTGKFIKGNSFLYNNSLLRVTSSNEQLNLCIINLDSFSLVKNYNYFEDREFEFKNSPILSLTNGKYNSDLLNRYEFFQTIGEGDLAIAANTIDNNNCELLIGSRELVTIQRPMAGAPMMGSSLYFGVGMGMNGYPGFYPGYGYPVNQTTYTQLAYFKVDLTYPNFNFQNGLANRNILDKLNDFEDKRFGNSPPDIHTIYKFGNKIHYGYYTKWTNSFYIVEF